MTHSVAADSAHAHRCGEAEWGGEDSGGRPHAARCARSALHTLLVILSCSVPSTFEPYGVRSVMSCLAAPQNRRCRADCCIPAVCAAS